MHWILASMLLFAITLNLYVLIHILFFKKMTWKEKQEKYGTTLLLVFGVVMMLISENGKELLVFLKNLFF